MTARASSGPSQPPRWPRESAEACAQRLDISQTAASLFQASEVLDLHVDSFIWTRLCGYRLDRRHTPGWLGARWARQVDLPRLRQVGIGAATWVITTNPLRTARGRARAFEHNAWRLRHLLEANPEVRVVSDCASYREAVAAGQHAAFLAVQGGNAVDADLGQLDGLSRAGVIRVTLVHMTASRLGGTSFPPGGSRRGLTPFGFEVVRALNERRIFVDLAHIERRAFFEALQAHDKSLPPIVTHTGVEGVHPHWRNLDDEQLHAIANRGGVIGIMYHTPFLTSGWRRGSVEHVADHIEHVAKTVGHHCVALGSDWDGAIITPKDMATCLELPRLVDVLLRRGWSELQLQGLLAGNFLRTLRDLRGE